MLKIKQKFYDIKGNISKFLLNNGIYLYRNNGNGHSYAYEDDNGFADRYVPIESNKILHNGELEIIGFKER